LFAFFFEQEDVQSAAEVNEADDGEDQFEEDFSTCSLRMMQVDSSMVRMSMLCMLISTALGLSIGNQA
jgi:hypothetical protein